MDSMNNIIKVFTLIVAGVTLYTLYKIIGTAAKFVEQFGSDNEGKRETMRKILGIQVGGLFIFYVCYIIATGLICFILEIFKQGFIWFLIGGILCSLIGLCVACYAIFRR
jgi:uncharacterized membrane-anchored protein